MLAVTDCRLPEDCRTSLTRLGFDTLPLPPFPLLPRPVASHPDMLIFMLGGTLITHRDYYKIAESEINTICSAGNFRLILSDEPVSDEYPGDVLFNAAPAGNFIIARESSVSRHILKIADSLGFSLINVRQGYARCSVVSVGDRAIFTSDRGIATSARSAGLDVLEVHPGHVRLDGYGTGFIGGASGCCGEKVYFCGNLETHPDAVVIRAFCAAHNCESVSLGQGELFDAGTLFFV